MPTVIDTLVLELGLDATKFNQQQRESIEALRKMQEQLERGGKEVESQGQKVGDLFKKIKTEALGMVGLFLGGKGIKEFIQYVVTADAQVARLANTTNMSTKEISTWQGVFRQAGGTLESSNATMQMLTDKINHFSLTGQTDMLPFLGTMNVSLQNANGKFKTAGELLFDINRAVQGMDPARARALMMGLGLDTNTINTLLLAQQTLKKMYEEQGKLAGANDASAKAATRLGQAWDSLMQSGEALGRNIFTKIEPLLTVVTGLMNFGVDGISHLMFGTPMKTRSTASALPAKVAGSPFPSVAEREAYIRDAAKRRGIDPDVAVRVAKSEGLKDGSYIGDRGSSFGDFQLHYGGVASGGMAASGLGDKFTKETGLNARDPTTWRQQTDFALDEAAKGGWGPWHGWKGLPRQGLPNPGMGMGSSGEGGGARVTNTTTINKVEIVTQAKDADGIARDIKGGLERVNNTASANYGLK